jgi:prepilin-type N-terminal cleavage/methylation domain-containing protein
MTRLSNRRGFSLVELLVSMVLIGVIATAMTRMILMQGRFYDKETARRSARSVGRNSMNVILSDLRMVQDTLGVAAIDPAGRSITVRVPYRFGLVCSANGGVTTASMLPVDSTASAMSAYGGYAVRGPNGIYSQYLSGGVLPTPSTDATVCTGDLLGQARITTQSLSGRAGRVVDLAPGTIAPIGTPMFFWQQVVYSFAPSTVMPGSGRFGLYRQVGGNAPEELMAPFTAAAGFRVYFRGDDTSRTIFTVDDTSRIKGLDIVLTSMSQRIPTGETSPTSSRVVSAVFFKNVTKF